MSIKVLLSTFLLLFFLSAPLHASDPININTATVKELATLNGIGEKTAKKIVEYRDAHGEFANIDDLAKVSGVSAKTVEKNRERLMIEDKKE